MFHFKKNKRDRGKAAKRTLFVSHDDVERVSFSREGDLISHMHGMRAKVAEDRDIRAKRRTNELHCWQIESADSRIPVRKDQE